MARSLKYANLTEDLILTSKSPPVPIPDQYFGQRLWQHLTVNGDRAQFIDGPSGWTMTGVQVRDTATAIALSLMDHGVKEGDVIFGYSPSHLYYSCSLVACAFAGFAVSGCSPAYPIRDVEFRLTDSAGKVILCSQDNVTTAVKVCEDNDQVMLIVILDLETVPANIESKVRIVTMRELLQRKAKSTDPQLPLTQMSKSPAEAVIFIMYSSGSTGAPKGVLKTHRNMVSYCVTMESGISFAGPIGAVVMCHSPMPHASGTMGTMGGITNGSTVVYNTTFTIESFLSCVQRYKVTHSFLIPSHIVILSKRGSQVEKYDVSSLRTVVTGGAPLPQSVVQDFRAVMGVERLYQVYGMTESGTVTGADAEIQTTETIGRPQRNVEVKFVDQETGLTVGANVVAEIWMRSPEQTIGYLNRPDADLENISPDGWLRSGDAGYFDDDGLMYIVDRYKELIKVDSCQVPPAELESILLTHGSVAEAAVVGVPHDVHGEVPIAFVVPKDPNVLPEEEQLLSFVNNQVADVKKIRGGIRFVESIPKISAGKVDRVTLKKNPQSLTFLSQ